MLGDDFDAEEAKFDGGARELERMRLTLETWSGIRALDWEVWGRHTLLSVLKRREDSVRALFVE